MATDRPLDHFDLPLGITMQFVQTVDSYVGPAKVSRLDDRAHVGEIVEEACESLVVVDRFGFAERERGT